MQNADRTDSRLIKLRGLVTPAGWDEEGKVIALAISTFDEDEYFVKKNQAEARLYPFLRKEIEVTGVMLEADGKKWIEVRNYSVDKKSAKTFKNNALADG